MLAAEEKPIKKRDMARYHRVAYRFEEWLDKHPHATHEEKVEMFNSIADSERDGEGN